MKKHDSKKHKLLSGIALAVCLMIGMAAPFAGALIQDLQTVSYQPLVNADSHYTYQGTLVNRVLALNAFLNASPVIEEIARKETCCADTVSVWTDLCSFLPISGQYNVYCEAFTLAPKQYHAQYQYTMLEYTQPDMHLQVILDSEDRLPLRIELKCAPDITTEFAKHVSTWEMVQNYTALLDLGTPADVYYSESTILRSSKSPLRGAPYTVETTVMPSGGMILLKLTGVSE